MKINTSRENETLRISLQGRLDTVTAPELENELNHSLDGVKLLVLDLAQLEYISSAGLRVILCAQKTMTRQGQMKLCNVSTSLMEIFDLTGFSRILTIE